MINKIYIYKTIYCLVLLIVLNGCQSVAENLQGKKRSDQGDEFLVKKKSPLEMPPDFNELPKPSNKTVEELSEENSEDIKTLLEIKVDVENEDEESTSLEDSIIKKFSKNVIKKY